MKESAIVIFLPESEISNECGAKIAQLISRDTGYEMEHITIHQLNSKELNSGIAAIANVMHHVRVKEPSELHSEIKIDSATENALVYIINKYGNAGKIGDIRGFRVRFMVDAVNAFNSDRKSADLVEFKNVIRQIATHQGECASIIRNLFPKCGLTRDHLESILSVHNYYTKSYV